MNRDMAIHKLVDEELLQLSVANRESMLMDWWVIDEKDSEFESLPQDLKRIIQSGEFPGDVANPVYDPLLKVALKHAYLGVLNSYLHGRLLALGIEAKVVGQVEPLEPCPCCGYCVHESQGGYEICPVCYWEDDGETDAEEYSPGNHISLKDARVNFERIGAARDSLREHVLQDGRLRYKNNLKRS